MKIAVFLSALVLFSAVPATAQVALRRGDVVIDKVLPEVTKTPEYQITGSNKRSRNQDWLVVEAEFTTVPEVIDELTFKYSILLNGQLLVGEVTHVNIPKGKEHFSVAYVSPRTIDRFMGGKGLNAAAVENIKVEVSKQGQVLSEKALKPTAIPNVAQVTGMILNKTETPFAPLYWDRYEAIKAGR